MGVPISVNTVSKHKVSVEKESVSDEDVVKSSEIQEEAKIKHKEAPINKKRERNVFILVETRHIQDYYVTLWDEFS